MASFIDFLSSIGLRKLDLDYYKVARALIAISQLPLAAAETRLDAITEPLSFYQNVSPSKELRDASNEAESLVRDFGVESSMRLDVFEAKAAAEKNLKASGQWDKLSSEERRLVDKLVLDGTRAGLALPEKERTELTTLKKELSQACLEFSVSDFAGFLQVLDTEIDFVRKTSTRRMYDFNCVMSNFAKSCIGCDLIHQRRACWRTKRRYFGLHETH